MTKIMTIFILALALLLATGVFSATLVQAAEIIPDPEFLKATQAKEYYLPLVPYEPASGIKRFDEKMVSILKENKLVGMSVLAFRGEKIIFRGAYGWADLKNKRPAKPDTIFRTASISKMVVATALMQLYEQGKFKLDDDIGDYLGYKVRNPNYPDVKITFKQLLTHTSSIVDKAVYDGFIEKSPWILRSVDIKDMLVPGGMYYSPNTYADYAPGSNFSYSNFGAGIQASLVEVISGKPFDKYCNEYIFNPLKMDSSFDPADIKNKKKSGVLYIPDKDFTHFAATIDDLTEQPRGSRMSPLGSALALSPAGGMRANVLDIFKFMMAHLNGGSYKKSRILKKDTVDMMHGMEWFGYGLNGFYRQKGLGFHITDDFVPGQRFIGHSAEAYGLIGDAYFDPDTKFGMIFLINGGNYTNESPFFSVENAIAEAIYGEFAENIAPVREIRGKINSNIMTVNNRKLFLPVPAASYLAKSGEEMIFVPVITAADVLKVKIESDGDDVFTFFNGLYETIITVDKPEIVVNGEKKPLLTAPYRAGDQVMVPLKELTRYLKVKADINFQ